MLATPLGLVSFWTKQFISANGGTMSSLIPDFAEIQLVFTTCQTQFWDALRDQDKLPHFPPKRSRILPIDKTTDKKNFCIPVSQIHNKYKLLNPISSNYLSQKWILTLLFDIRLRVYHAHRIWKTPNAAQYCHIFRPARKVLYQIGLHSPEDKRPCTAFLHDWCL